MQRIENYFYSENPPAFQRDAWYGLIFRWYGVDKIGNIAIFETGELPIPKKIFTDKSAYREIDLYFRQLPKITESKVKNEKLLNLKKANGEPVDYSDYLTESNRGLYFISEKDAVLETKKYFGYVERENLYGYYVVAVPNKKLNVSNLPEKIKHLLFPYEFPVIFSDIEKVDVTKYFFCD